MSHPLSAEPISVLPDAVDDLATELRCLAAELLDDAGSTRSASTSFMPALGGDQGWDAAATATAWARLQELLAARAAVLARTLAAAAAAYRAEDRALSGGLAAPRGPR
jgi:hypothetical protein